MHLLKIRTEADFKYIIGYQETDQMTSFDSKRFVVVTEQVYKRVKENFLSKRMKYPAFDRNVDFGNLRFDDDIDINDLKNSAIQVYRIRFVDIHINNDFTIMSSEFVMMNNYMCSKGYFFTPFNREELYLDILNSGDPETIQMLERYLLIFEEYSKFRHHLTKYQEFKEEMLEAKTVADIYKIYEERTGEALLQGMNSI